jgi:RNA polymerase sigma factor (sigma-70 family)
LEQLEYIIDECKKENARAQNELFKRYAPKLLGICCRYIRDRDDAEDALQETFIKIFSNIHQFKAEGSFEGWMKRIAANTALNHLKEKNKVQFDDLAKVSLTKVEEDEKEYQLMVEADAQKILRCIQDLPVGYRTILNMYLMEEFSHKEIAEKLGIEESTSRSQYTRARKALLELINTKKEKEVTKTKWAAIGIWMSLLSVSWMI